MKKTTKETRELMDNLNEFLSEDYGTSATAAEEFKVQYAQQLASKLGSQWQTKGGNWMENSNIADVVHDLIWEFATNKYPEHMGDDDRSENFVQSVMQNM
jgi:hypothetical protein